MTPEQRALVLHLEALTASAKRGEVQFYISSAAVLPMTEAGWGAMQVEGYAAFGDLVARLDKPSLVSAYAKTLEGLQQAAGQANQGFEKLCERFEPPKETP